LAATVRAAERWRYFVDIAADSDLIQLSRQLTNLPICVSAVEPERFVKAVGADLIEIGNFDSFYAGRRFEAEVLALTHQTLAPARYYFICYRSPHSGTRPASTVGRGMVKAGADIIKLKEEPAAPAHAGTLGLIEKAATLAAAYRNFAVSVPVLCAPVYLV